MAFQKSHLTASSELGENTNTAEALIVPQPQLSLTLVERPIKSGGIDATVRRQLGAFYTPESAVACMADWVVRHEGEHILEPSFGDGVFLKAVADRATVRRLEHVRLYGVEIDKATYAEALEAIKLPNLDLRRQDFLSVSPFKVDAVIGNPPYVRLRDLSSEQRDTALEAARIAMGVDMDPSGSVWMPFVLHSMRFLKRGGRLAFVLPYDMTYVRYARPLWDFLCRNFGTLTLLRTHERIFSDILQDVVVLLADNYGGHTDVVTYSTFKTLSDLVAKRRNTHEEISVDEVVSGGRPFLSSLLSQSLRQLLNVRLKGHLTLARHLVKFNIGYVSGDKVFFHPSSEDIDKYDIPPTSLTPALTSTRSLKGMGLLTSSIPESDMQSLFLPNPDALTAGERRYIRYGEAVGVSDRYKCKVRNPWFVVPGTRVPDVIVSVFSECPVLLLNDAKYFASNSLLCGFISKGSSRDLVARWYTSLTLLQCELEVHALGGGVMIMIPGEADRILLPKSVTAQEQHLSAVDRALRNEGTKQAYRSGDEWVLIQQMGLNNNEIELIHDGIETLSFWRTSSRVKS